MARFSGRDVVALLHKFFSFPFISGRGEELLPEEKREPGGRTFSRKITTLIISVGRSISTLPSSSARFSESRPSLPSLSPSVRLFLGKVSP